ncbi:MAG: nicotinamide mononucleotide transporter [Bacteroidetes bacterium]|nr:nicotinamide mononucleotide transporter [Bacteroidota bacterium]
MSYSQWLEIVVVVLGLLYIVLIAIEVRAGWIAGVIGSALFVVSNIYQHLYMDMVLNSYYVWAGIYGWYMWGRKDDGEALPVANIPKQLFAVLLAGSAVLTVAFGYGLSQFTNNSLPYLDAGVTILSFLATWMSTRKYIENWLVWLVADPLAVILYYYKGGMFYPMLFAIYTGMAAYGYLSWRKHMKNGI